MTLHTPPYHVTVERSGRGWRVRVEGVGGLATVHARDLSDVEPRARKLVWGYTGVNPADIALDIDVRLPATVQMRLSMAEQLCEEAAAEVEGAIGELLDGGMSVLDIGRVLRRRGQMPMHSLTITNQEVVEHGLAHHPDAIGIQWDDHGRFLTCTCRDCLEKMRAAYLDVDPDDESIIVYDQPFTCDYCPPKKRPNKAKSIKVA